MPANLGVAGLERPRGVEGLGGLFEAPLDAFGLPGDFEPLDRRQAEIVRDRPERRSDRGETRRLSLLRRLPRPEAVSGAERLGHATDPRAHRGRTARRRRNPAPDLRPIALDFALSRRRARLPGLSERISARLLVEALGFQGVLGEPLGVGQGGVGEPVGFGGQPLEILRLFRRYRRRRRPSRMEERRPEGNPRLVALSAGLLDPGRRRKRTSGGERRKSRRRIGHLLLDRLALSGRRPRPLQSGFEQRLEAGDVLLARQRSSRQRFQLCDGRIEPRRPFGEPARLVGEVFAVLDGFARALGDLAERRVSLADRRRIEGGRSRLPVQPDGLDRVAFPRGSERLRFRVRLGLSPLDDQRAERRERGCGRTTRLEGFGVEKTERAGVAFHRGGVVIGLGLDPRQVPPLVGVASAPLEEVLDRRGVRNRRRVDRDFCSVLDASPLLGGRLLDRIGGGSALVKRPGESIRLSRRESWKIGEVRKAPFGLGNVSQDRRRALEPREPRPLGLVRPAVHADRFRSSR